MLTILIGLIPAVLIRWAILRKPISVGIAIAVCAVILIAVLILLEVLHMNSKALPSAVAVCSFFILCWDATDSPKNRPPKP